MQASSVRPGLLILLWIRLVLTLMLTLAGYFPKLIIFLWHLLFSGKRWPYHILHLRGFFFFFTISSWKYAPCCSIFLKVGILLFHIGNAFYLLELEFCHPSKMHFLNVLRCHVSISPFLYFKAGFIYLKIFHLSIRVNIQYYFTLDLGGRIVVRQYNLLSDLLH